MTLFTSRLVWAAVLGLFTSLSINLMLPTIASAQNAGTASWGAVIAAAEREGTVVLYTAQPLAMNERLKSEFAKAYPNITIEVFRALSGLLMSKVEQEQKSRTPGADVLITTDLVWLKSRAKDGSLVAPMGPDAKKWPAEYMLDNSIGVIVLSPLAMVYNSNMVKAPMTGYKDFLRPDLKGKFGIPAVEAATVVAWYEWLEKTQGADFLNRLSEQIPRVYSVTQNAQAVAAGETGAALMASVADPMQLIKQGAPLKLVLPKPGFSTRHVAAALGWAAHPNSAQVLMNFLLSPRGQIAMTGDGGAASPIHVQGSIDPTGFAPFDPEPYTPAVVEAFRARFNALFRPQ